MSKHEREIREISELPYYKDEYKEELKAMGIRTLSDLLDALYDEERKKEIVDRLKGVGPKIAEHWIEVIEERGILEESVSESKEEEKVNEEGVVEKTKEGEIEQEKVAEQEVKSEEVVIEEAEVSAEEAAIVEKGGYLVKAKPVLDPTIAKLLALRRKISERRPAFFRQEWFRYKRLGEKWRKPRGLHSKMRRHYKYRPPVVSIGYRGPKKVRGLHPSGFEEVMVYNPSQLEGIDPKRQAVRIGSTVGYKKRIEIESKADQLGIRILNRTG
ncbi:MAG: 50S ribosomal protein L32e [Methanomassiliicoccales archaeon]|jgi:large subunit ribosomal protein L32e|nr:50S ribosomal protein L32e [Methanomassiliicoccales archaeon]